MKKLLIGLVLFAAVPAFSGRGYVDLRWECRVAPPGQTEGISKLYQDRDITDLYVYTKARPYDTGIAFVSEYYHWVQDALPITLIKASVKPSPTIYRVKQIDYQGRNKSKNQLFIVPESDNLESTLHIGSSGKIVPMYCSSVQ